MNQNAFAGVDWASLLQKGVSRAIDVVTVRSLSPTNTAAVYAQPAAALQANGGGMILLLGLALFLVLK